MPAPPTTHPADAVLADYVLGKLPDSDDQAVAEHLIGCHLCQSRAAGLQPPDTLAALVAAVGSRPDAGSAADATPRGDSATWGTDPPPAPAPPGTPPELTGHPRYRVVRPLGEGGMGVVWLAEHTVMGRQVALKVIHPGVLSRPGAAERFRREVRAAARLQHPNIAAAYDADEADGNHFLVMEYVPGETLQEVVRRGPLPAADACRAAREAALGLAHAHAAGLVHRDVKPGNLIRATGGAVKVLDFGLVAAAGDGGEGLTGERVAMGTPDYIAPEQADDAAAADARSDVYALGCTLYHLLAGRVPYPDRSALKKLDGHRDPAVRPDPIPGLPPGLAAVVARMTATDPAGRYPSAAAVVDALAPFCDPAPPEPPPARRRGWPVAAGLALLAAATAGFAAVYTVHRGNEVVTVETDDPDIEVVVRRNGELVRVVDTKSKKAWELDTTRMRLAPDGGELTLDLPDGAALVLRRNGSAVATIRRGPPAPAPIPRAGGVEEVHRIPFAFAGWDDFAADGSEFLAYTAAGGKRVGVIFDAATGKETGRFPVPAGEYVFAWFIPGSRELLLSVDLKIGRYDRATGAKRADLFDIPANSMVMPLSRAGDAVAIWLSDAAGPARHRIVVHDLRNGKERFRVDPLHAGAILGQSPRFSPDGKLMSTTDTTPAASVLRLWDAASGVLVRTIDVAGSLYCGNAFSADSRELVASYGPPAGAGMVGRWAVATGEQLRATSHQPVHSSFASFLLGGRAVGYHVDGATAVRYVSVDTGQAFAEYRPGRRILGAAAPADSRLGLYVTDDALRVVRVPAPPPVPPGPAAPPAPATESSDRRALLAVTDYREGHGLDLAGLRAWVAALPAGFRPVDITAREGAPPPRFDAIAVRDGQAPEAEAHLDLDRSGVDNWTDFTTMSRAGWSLRISCPYDDGAGRPRHHVWVRDRAGWFANGYVLAQAGERADQWRRDRVRPRVFYRNTPDTGPGRADRPMGALLEPDHGLPWEYYPEVPPAGLGAKLAEARGRGWRPHALGQFGAGADRTYALLTVPNPTGLVWEFQADLTVAGYEAELAGQLQSGRRALAVLSAGDGAAVRYTAVWVEYTPPR